MSAAVAASCGSGCFGLCHSTHSCPSAVRDFMDRRWCLWGGWHGRGRAEGFPCVSRVTPIGNVAVGVSVFCCYSVLVSVLCKYV